jgi:hypothetical protein
MSQQHRDQVDHDFALCMVTDRVLHGRSVHRRAQGHRARARGGSGGHGPARCQPATIGLPSQSGVITGTCSKCPVFCMVYNSSPCSSHKAPPSSPRFSLQNRLNAVDSAGRGRPGPGIRESSGCTVTYCSTQNRPPICLVKSNRTCGWCHLQEYCTTVTVAMRSKLACDEFRTLTEAIHFEL